ncbi:MAG: phosphoenolpyruvate synthase [Bdellovibrionaceae bacterium]|nr:phosphoenolpyruvate synthase [Pseudobdellovibrionaceae bacterium]
MKRILTTHDSIETFRSSCGGKATNMAIMSSRGFPVPGWFCVGAEAFQEFLRSNHLEDKLEFQGTPASFSKYVEELFTTARIPQSLHEEISKELNKNSLEDSFVAVRSSGLDEDSAEHSFAGQFSSYLFQKGLEQIETSLKLCWASAYSERALSYRLQKGLPVSNLSMGVVIQKMIFAESAGVAFSRHPIRALDRDHLLVSSVWGLGEGLVSGELDADSFEVHRDSKKITSTIVEKNEGLFSKAGGGLEKKAIPESQAKASSLTDTQVLEVAKLTLDLEKSYGSPQDCEWAFEKGKLFCVQTRPITNIPPDIFFADNLKGERIFLWDNSNIIESYSGVTSPLTFSFAARAYRQVYIQFCQVMGVPAEMIESHESMYRNMLGQIRGRIYYNLINWYRLVLMLPGSANNKAFMETMMGVKQKLKPEMAGLFDFTKNPPQYSFLHRMTLIGSTLWRFNRIDRIVNDFRENFDREYDKARKTEFRKLSLTDLMEHYHDLENKMLKNWKAPIINDYLCMIFFGLLKKLTENWVAQGNDGASLQNDLLCGQGDLESTEPTKMLMRIAAHLDLKDTTERDWILTQSNADILKSLRSDRKSSFFAQQLEIFLDKYGFRCINELKLEESDLHDNPEFAINSVVSYIRTKSYSIEAMEKREVEIRSKAEEQARGLLGGPKRAIYFWVVKQTRKAVRNRENLRFARTKIFGIARHLFRAMGEKYQQLGLLSEPQDIFFLTIEELVSLDEGRASSLQVRTLADARKKEFAQFNEEIPPPDRLMTKGNVAVSSLYPQILLESDLLASEAPVSTDPDVLIGTPCCPGVIEGVVRVAKDPKDAEGLNGEILVTSRTDPGWVPLYPACSGLLIERGSLLSHSAVVARELGLPTIVGISGGLMTKLKTGMRVRIDAGRGEVRILRS